MKTIKRETEPDFSSKHDGGESELQRSQHGQGEGAWFDGKPLPDEGGQPLAYRRIIE